MRFSFAVSTTGVGSCTGTGGDVILDAGGNRQPYPAGGVNALVFLTINGSSLTQAHLDSAWVPKGTPIGTTEGGREFTRAILDNELELDVALARQDNIDAAMAMKAKCDDLGAIVLECTNMEPYAADISRATGLPVFSIQTLMTWFQRSLVPKSYANSR